MPTVLAIIFSFVALVIPGLYAAIALGLPRKMPPTAIWACAWAINGGIGYIAFWLFFLNRSAGVTFSWVIAGASILLLLRLFQKKNLRNEVLGLDYTIPLGLMIATSVFYISILSAPQAGQRDADSRFLSGTLPPDNIIPMIFADRLYLGEDPRPILGDWRSSDRPPLQAGLTLIHYPWVSWLFGGFFLHVQYQLLATFAQCIWVPAVWVLCRSMRISIKTTAFVLGSCIFSGFFLLNSVYVWPKLLSAALALMSLSLMLAPKTAADSGSNMSSNNIVAASLAALAMLSHAGVAFFYPAMAIVALRRSFFGSVKAAACSAVILVVWMLPWSAYQKYYDPPGNRLLKWHLAGVTEIDDRTFPDALVDSYAHLSFRQFLENKAENAKMLVGPECSPPKFLWPSREDQFFHLLKTLGILNAGWIVLALLLLGLGYSRLSAETRMGALLLEMASATAVIWIIAIFLPGGTSVHAGSYAMVLSLFLGLAILVSWLPAWLKLLMCLFQLAYFLPVWAFFAKPNGMVLRPHLVAITAGMGLCILLALTWMTRVKESLSTDAGNPH